METAWESTPTSACRRDKRWDWAVTYELTRWGMVEGVASVHLEPWDLSTDCWDKDLVASIAFSVVLEVSWAAGSEWALRLCLLAGDPLLSVNLEYHAGV